MRKQIQQVHVAIPKSSSYKYVRRNYTTGPQRLWPQELSTPCNQPPGMPLKTHLAQGPPTCHQVFLSGLTHCTYSLSYRTKSTDNKVVPAVTGLRVAVSFGDTTGDVLEEVQAPEIGNWYPRHKFHLKDKVMLLYSNQLSRCLPVSLCLSFPSITSPLNAASVCPLPMQDTNSRSSSPQRLSYFIYSCAVTKALRYSKPTYFD